MKKIFLISLSALVLLSFSLNCVYAEENVSKTLTLEENWRITSDLDLEVPINTTLTIKGNGYYIYEMGGRLINSGEGSVVFENTILYPLDNDIDLKKIYLEGDWNADESARLLLERQGIHSELFQTPSGESIAYKHSMMKTDTGYKYAFTMTSSADVKGTFVIALYDEQSRLVGVDTTCMETASKDYTAPQTNITTSSQATTYKIMFWDSLDTLKPICNALEGNI